jgi:uncharacterized MAPEG superfamily protein
VESFPVYASAILLAIITRVSSSLVLRLAYLSHSLLFSSKVEARVVDRLALAYVLLRLLYTIFYIYGRHPYTHRRMCSFTYTHAAARLQHRVGQAANVRVDGELDHHIRALLEEPAKSSFP